MPGEGGKPAARGIQGIQGLEIRRKQDRRLGGLLRSRFLNSKRKEKEARALKDLVKGERAKRSTGLV